MSRIVSIIVFVILVILLLILFKQCTPNASLVETMTLEDKASVASEGVIDRSKNEWPKAQANIINSDERAKQEKDALEQALNQSIADAISKEKEQAVDKQADNTAVVTKKETENLTENKRAETQIKDKESAKKVVATEESKQDKKSDTTKSSAAEEPMKKEVKLVKQETTNGKAQTPLADKKETTETTLADVSAKNKEEDAKELATDDVKSDAHSPESAVALAAQKALDIIEKQTDDVKQILSGSSDESEQVVEPKKEEKKTDIAKVKSSKDQTNVVDELVKKDSKEQVLIILQGVNFKYGSARLTEDSSVQLDRMVSRFKHKKGLKVEVAGYSDNVGNPKANLYLSKLRAEAVKKYFVSHGVAAGRLTAKGYGDNSPIADNSTIEGRDSNRRVELHIK